MVWWLVPCLPHPPCVDMPNTHLMMCGPHTLLSGGGRIVVRLLRPSQSQSHCPLWLSGDIGSMVVVMRC